MNQCGETHSEGDTMETTERGGNLESAVAYIHGACLVFLDGLGSGQFHLQEPVTTVTYEV